MLRTSPLVGLDLDFSREHDLPTVYYITDHYLNYEYVLVSLEHVGAEALEDMIRRSYNLAILKTRRN